MDEKQKDVHISVLSRLTHNM